MINLLHKKKTLFFIGVLIFSLPPFFINSAKENEDQKLNRVYLASFDNGIVNTGAAKSFFENNFIISFSTGTLIQQSKVEVMELNQMVSENKPLVRCGTFYQFDFKNKAAYNPKMPISIKITYPKTDSNNYFKQIYYYNKTNNKWIALPSKDDPVARKITAAIHLPYARLAVFADVQKLVMGSASWYKYKNGNFAASPDYPLGTKLRVYNLSTANRKAGKAAYIDVVVADHGPDRSKHPTRVIDLDKIAFARLASLGSGLVSVYIKPTYIPPADKKVLASKIVNSAEKNIPVPVIKSKAAIIKDSATGEILFEKEAVKQLPLASLTKLVAMSVFMETSPDLNRTVAYSSQDLKQNAKYCDISVIAKLKVSNGETMKIKDLVYSALVGSANNAVETLVRVSGLERDSFIERMNSLAMSWGAKSAYFIEPTGLAPENACSAQDYIVITENAMKYDIIKKASITKNYEFHTINTKQYHNIKNSNKLIHEDVLPIIGSKTGYLEEAGFCLMIRVSSDSGHPITIVTFGSGSKEISYSDTENLAKYAMKKVN